MTKLQKKHHKPNITQTHHVTQLDPLSRPEVLFPLRLQIQPSPTSWMIDMMVDDDDFAKDRNKPSSRIRQKHRPVVPKPMRDSTFFLPGFMSSL